MEPAVRGHELSLSARRAAYGSVSTSMAMLSDRALSELLDTAVPMGSGVGGKSALLEIAGRPVFVKRVPLTDLEKRPEHVRSTANLFDLPVFSHFGVGIIGGPGFGAWRELAVHTMTTDWVLAAEYEGFPLMYHWRVLPDSIPLPEELADVESAVAYWGGALQIRRRIEEIQQASSSVALFLEYIPQNLHQWLGSQVELGGSAADQACAMAEKGLQAGISFMNGQGLLHFDTHFENILTDGRRLYFADYGLAISSRFDLSQAETEFFDRHQDYDRWHAAEYYVNWLITALYGCRGEERYARVHAYAQGEHPTGVPTQAAAIIARHAPVAAAVSEFNRKFQRESRQIPYPVDVIRQLHTPPA